MAPDAAVLLQDNQRLAQIAARHAKFLGQFAFRRQPAVARQVDLREIGLELHQRGLLVVFTCVRRFDQFRSASLLTRDIPNRVDGQHNKALLSGENALTNRSWKSNQSFIGQKNQGGRRHD
jgi:hypothetical protein